MALLSELQSIVDPTTQEEQDPEAVGENTRADFPVDDEIGRRAIQKVQPELEGYTPGGFFKNLGSNIGEFAQGLFTLGTYPIRHPETTAEGIGYAAEHPIAAAEKVGGIIAKGYQEAYTPQPDESIPGMILRRLYEKPFDTLMDASALGQIAFGGAGLATRAATMGVRGAVEGGEAGAALVRAAAGTVADLPEEGLAVARKAASAQRVIDLFDAMQERAKLLDPLTIAQSLGTIALKTVAPDALAALRATKKMTDDMSERTIVRQTGEAQMQKQMQEAVGDLNPAELAVFHPYVAGRVNFDRPVGEQLMQHTGEWAPVKGDVIRPDALEAARQKYLPIQQQLQKLRGMDPQDVAQIAGQKAMGDAQEAMGDKFDPLHPDVQQSVVDSVAAALRENDEAVKARAAGEMVTSLQIAREKAWRTKIDDMVAQNTYRNARDAEASFPRPEPVSVDEAMQAMGPQGGIYFPHSAEAYNSQQSTIDTILKKLGEASTFKENTYALYRAGVMENQDPVKQLMRAYSSFGQGKHWVQIGTDAVEDAVKEGVAEKFKAGKWNWKTDPDVIAGTHQPWHPGLMLTNELVEEDGQHILTRLLEGSPSDRPGAGASTIEAATVPEPGNAMGPHAAGGMPAGTTIGNLNFSSIMRGLVEQAEKGPMYRFKKELPIYKIPTAMGHSLAAVRDSIEPATNPLIRMMDMATQWWNWGNINWRVSHTMNRAIGHTTFAAMQGVHPFSPRGLTALWNMGKALGYKAGLTSSEEAGKLAQVFDLPGISSGLQRSLGRSFSSAEEQALKSGFAPLRGLGKWGAMLAKANSGLDSIYRAASMFYELSPNAIERGKRMLGHATDTMSLSEKIDSFAKAGAEVNMATPEYRAALKNVNRFFHDYTRTTPFERQVTRRIFPYYKFFKHSTELITRFPFEHPLKAAVGRAVGQAAMQDAKDQLKQWGLDWDRDVPPSQRDSLPVWRSEGEDGKPVVWMYNTKGKNPFSHMSGYMAEQALQMLNPVVRVALERATGVNLYTRERYRGAISSFTGREVDPRTGQIVDSFNHPTFGEAFLRSFWPYQTVRELVAQGRVPTDTASLLEMARNGPGAWVYDKRGFPLRKPQVSGAQPLGRLVGLSVSPLQQPTPEQRTARKAIVSDQIHTLWQRYPQQRDKILSALDDSAQEVLDQLGNE